MRALLIACVLAIVAAGRPAAALDDDCDLVPSTVGRESDPFGNYMPALDSALSLPKEGAFALRLPVLPVRHVADCPGARQSVQIAARGEPLTLQFGTASASQVKVAVPRVWPFEWKWRHSVHRAFG